MTMIKSMFGISSPPLRSAECLRNTVIHNQLIAGLETLHLKLISTELFSIEHGRTYTPQVPHAFVQTRRKDRVDIAEHTLVILQTDLLAQEPDDMLETLVAGALEARLTELRRVGERGEADRHCGRVSELQSKVHVTRSVSYLSHAACRSGICCCRSWQIDVALGRERLYSPLSCSSSPAVSSALCASLGR